MNVLTPHIYRQRSNPLKSWIKSKILIIPELPWIQSDYLLDDWTYSTYASPLRRVKTSLAPTRRAALVCSWHTCHTCHIRWRPRETIISVEGELNFGWVSHPKTIFWTLALDSISSSTAQVTTTQSFLDGFRIIWDDKHPFSERPCGR